MSHKIQNRKWSQLVFPSVHQLLDQFLWLVLYVIEPTGWYTAISYQSWIFKILRVLPDLDILGKRTIELRFFVKKKHLLFPTLKKVKKLFYRNCEIFVPILRIKPWYFVLLSMLTAQKHKERATRIDKDSASKMSYKNRKLFINLKI